MTVRSARLGGPTSIAAGTSSVLFTCPADMTTIVKRVAVFAQAADTTVYWYIGAATDGNALWRQKVPVAGGVEGTQEVWFVLEPGESIRAFAAAAGAVTASVHGAILDGVA